MRNLLVGVGVALCAWESTSQASEMSAVPEIHSEPARTTFTGPPSLRFRWEPRLSTAGPLYDPREEIKRPQAVERLPKKFRLRREAIHSVQTTGVITAAAGTGTVLLLQTVRPLSFLFWGYLSIPSTVAIGLGLALYVPSAIAELVQYRKLGYRRNVGLLVAGSVLTAAGGAIIGMQTFGAISRGMHPAMFISGLGLATAGVTTLAVYTFRSDRHWEAAAESAYRKGLQVGVGPMWVERGGGVALSGKW